ncbi:T-box transcription factor TBX22-like [Palaemon carinicauda]|uniref:T-box transcription factor TBX22-like n=1 Tax=Palaemon carinicauda TaxID=392227 RepID=UPI0035B69D79
MLSSRAAAFSVKALLNTTTDRAKDALQQNASSTKNTRKKNVRGKHNHVRNPFMESHHQGITESSLDVEPPLVQDTNTRLLPMDTCPLGSQNVFHGGGTKGMCDEEDELVDVENCADLPDVCGLPSHPIDVNGSAIPSSMDFSSSSFGSGDALSLSSPYYPQGLSKSSSTNTDWQDPSSNVDRASDHLFNNDASLDLSCSGVTIQLLQTELWSKFNDLGTEMIITKNGRRMFPVVKVGLRDLHPHKTYMVYLDMIAVDTRRYRYVYPSSRWMVAGTGEPLGDHPPYIHPDSPSTGAQWMAAPSIAFDRLKLTNNKTRLTKGQIILHSMQKYQPRIWVQEVDPSTTCADLPSVVNMSLAQSASFPETTFITVTAYQNQQITRLKIDSNPFAKGFRDTTKQKEMLDRRLHQETDSHSPQSLPAMSFILPFGIPGPPHIPLARFPPHYPFPSPASIPQFGLACPHAPPQFHHSDPVSHNPYALNSPVSPPISPLVLSQQWYHDALGAVAREGVEGGGGRADEGRLPWMQDASPSALFHRSNSMPLFFPPFMPSLHVPHPHALDLTKRKDET